MNFKNLLGIVLLLSNGKLQGLIGRKALKNVFTIKPDPNKKESFYVMNYEKGGFVMISADKRTQEILAYGESGSRDSTTRELPAGLIAWLQETDESINRIRE